MKLSVLLQILVDMPHTVLTDAVKGVLLDNHVVDGIS